jgi:hypothetical protein
VRLTTDRHLVSRLRISAAIPLLQNKRKDKFAFNFAYCFNVRALSLRSAHTVTASVM